MSRSIVIADSSCLIVLQNIGEIEILPRLFERIYITPEVSAEFGAQLDWITVRSGNDAERLVDLKNQLDAGEASSIALALETVDSLLIIDEKKGRRVASDLGITIVGTVGVLIMANKSGYIDYPTTLLERLESADFRLSEGVKNELMGSID